VAKDRMYEGDELEAYEAGVKAALESLYPTLLAFSAHSDTPVLDVPGLESAAAFINELIERLDR